MREFDVHTFKSIFITIKADYFYVEGDTVVFYREAFSDPLTGRFEATRRIACFNSPFSVVEKEETKS